MPRSDLILTDYSPETKGHAMLYRIDRDIAGCRIN